MASKNVVTAVLLALLALLCGPAAADYKRITKVYESAARCNSYCPGYCQAQALELTAVPGCTRISKYSCTLTSNKTCICSVCRRKNHWYSVCGTNTCP
jgi:hypothetical protein